MSLEKIVGTIALIFWACVFIFQRNNPGGKNNVYIGIACLIIAFIMLLWPSKKKNSSKSTSVLPGARDNTEITNKQKKNLKTALNDSPTNTIPSCDEIHFQHSSAYKTALFLKWCKKHSEFLPADNYPIYMQRDWGIVCADQRIALRERAAIPRADEERSPALSVELRRAGQPMSK